MTLEANNFNNSNDIIVFMLIRRWKYDNVLSYITTCVGHP